MNADPAWPEPRHRRPLTIVGHLLSQQAEAGLVVGHVEGVDTGEVVTDRDQLVGLIARWARRGV